MSKPLLLSALLLALPAAAQTASTARTHLLVPATNLVTLELSFRVDLTTGALTSDAATYENGKRQFLAGADGIEVPKGRTLVVTDAQAWVLHETGTGTPASLELILEHPYGGYFGTMAMFTFPDLRENAMGVQRQTWTSGFAVPETLRVKLWAQQVYPRSLMSMARVVLHGYYL